MPVRAQNRCYFPFGLLGCLRPTPLRCCPAKAVGTYIFASGPAVRRTLSIAFAALATRLITFSPFPDIVRPGLNGILAFLNDESAFVYLLVFLLLFSDIVAS